MSKNTIFFTSMQFVYWVYKLFNFSGVFFLINQIHRYLTFVDNIDFKHLNKQIFLRNFLVRTFTKFNEILKKSYAAVPSQTVTHCPHLNIWFLQGQTWQMRWLCCILGGSFCIAGNLPAAAAQQNPSRCKVQPRAPFS